jgi:predicted amidohydrolase YtcJ
MEALDAYTVRGAYAEFAEDWKGQLKPGHVADIAIWDNDLETPDPDAFLRIKARTTICGGRITYSC